MEKKEIQVRVKIQGKWVVVNLTSEDRKKIEAALKEALENRR